MDMLGAGCDLYYMDGSWAFLTVWRAIINLSGFRCVPDMVIDKNRVKQVYCVTTLSVSTSTCITNYHKKICHCLLSTKEHGYLVQESVETQKKSKVY